jgi:hypothetical protein
MPEHEALVASLLDRGFVSTGRDMNLADSLANTGKRGAGSVMPMWQLQGIRFTEVAHLAYARRSRGQHSYSNSTCSRWFRGAPSIGCNASSSRSGVGRRFVGLECGFVGPNLDQSEMIAALGLLKYLERNAALIAATFHGKLAEKSFRFGGRVGKLLLQRGGNDTGAYLASRRRRDINVCDDIDLLPLDLGRTTS